MRQALDVIHVPYPNRLRSPFANAGDEESASKATLNFIENTLFKTATPPEEVAGIVLEVVQGEGGYIPAPAHFVREIRRICDDHGILLIVDEVQSGFGRTGKMFASDHYDLKPDIMMLAKGIGSGLPIGACVARADVMNWGKGAHASTFGGNPVCIASALKTIELLENGLVENSAQVGEHLQNRLRVLGQKYDCIGDVRGLGLMIGVEFVESKTTMTPAPELRDRIEMECYERGLIILGCGVSTIRFSPPLVLTKENADVAVEIFDAAISAAS